MKAGIIAAGDGSRFVRSGIQVPKPLLKVGGKTLMERTLEILVQGGVEEVAVIVNERMATVATYVQDLGLPVPVRTLVQTTESSMHSLHALAPLLSDDRFVLCTVDSIMDPGEAAGFIRDFAGRPEVKLELSYTDFIDDEKPLYVAVDAQQRVLALGEQAQSSPFVTVGLYGLDPEVLPLLDRTVDEGLKKLRNFLGFVVNKGATVRGYRLSKAIDVDRPADVEVAEEFLREREVSPCN